MFLRTAMVVSMLPSVLSLSKTALLPPSVQPVTAADRACFQRQTGQAKPAAAAIGKPVFCRCRHGFPQVFLLKPFHNNRINSGIVKLTCPLLVQQIDQLEDEGAISRINQDMDFSLVENAHERHAQIRQTLVQTGDSSMETIQARLGDEGTAAFLSAGVAGATPGSQDLKCLHAWLGDFLLLEEVERNYREDPVVQHFGDDLKLSGTETCRVLCDPSSTLQVAPPKPRNKQRLRTAKETARRKRRKEEQKD